MMLMGAVAILALVAGMVLAMFRNAWRGYPMNMTIVYGLPRTNVTR